MKQNWVLPLVLIITLNVLNSFLPFPGSGWIYFGLIIWLIFSLPEKVKKEIKTWPGKIKDSFKE